MSNMSENINEIMTALSKAQGKIQYASKDKANPYFKSKYADLASIWEACRSSLSEHGLAVVQTIDHREFGMVLITMLGHSSGQWIKSEMPIVVVKNDPQTLGSAITYYRRYSLAAIVGVAPDDDDDGEKAQTPYRNSNKDEHKQKRTISTIEIESLKNILSECDPAYQEYVNEYLNKTFHISDLSQITYDIYEKMKTSATKKMNEYQLKKQEKIERAT
jgi:hypothetical protein